MQSWLAGLTLNQRTMLLYFKLFTFEASDNGFKTYIFSGYFKNQVYLERVACANAHEYTHITKEYSQVLEL